MMLHNTWMTTETRPLIYQPEMGPVSFQLGYSSYKVIVTIGVTIAYGWNTAHVGRTLLVRDVTCGVGVKGTLGGGGRIWKN